MAFLSHFLTYHDLPKSLKFPSLSLVPYWPSITPCAYSIPINFAELQAHFEPASESEGVFKDTDEVEEDYPPADPQGSQAPAAYGWSRPASVVAQEAEPQQLYQQHLSLQLSQLRQETNRLLEHLVQKEREYQNLLRQTLEQKTQELYHLQLQFKSNETTASSASPPGSHGQRTDQELVDWLQLQGADTKTIEKVNA